MHLFCARGCRTRTAVPLRSLIDKWVRFYGQQRRQLYPKRGGQICEDTLCSTVWHAPQYIRIHLVLNKILVHILVSVHVCDPWPQGSNKTFDSSTGFSIWNGLSCPALSSEHRLCCPHTILSSLKHLLDFAQSGQVFCVSVWAASPLHACFLPRKVMGFRDAQTLQAPAPSARNWPQSISSDQNMVQTSLVLNLVQLQFWIQARFNLHFPIYED